MSQTEKLSARMRKAVLIVPLMKGEWATEVEALENQIAQWRILAFTQHACQAKYGDDGELQCNQCLIDFKRDSIEEINAKLLASAGRRMDEIAELRRDRERL